MFHVILEKTSRRKLDYDVMKAQLSYITRRALGGNRGRAWSLVSTIKIPDPVEANGDGYLYSVKLKFDRTGRKASRDVEDRQEKAIVQIIENASRSKGWMLPNDSSDGSPIDEQTVAESKSKKTRTFNPEDLIVSQGEHFAHLFKRESQIALVQSALDAYISSNFEDRFHCCLFGSPASGKTEVLRSFARMLGEDAVLTFDATSTTKAGAERILLETERIPPVLIVEEIEKTDEMSLRWLLGVLDHRAEVRKITHRMVAAKTVKLLCLATVNDLDLFNRMMDGALASRFSHKIYCPRPDRDVLQRILEREIFRCQGNPAWITPALDWCLEREGTNDPRRVITICLSGRDKLLTGEYQQHLANTMMPNS